jgi:hypothetical protein
MAHRPLTNLSAETPMERIFEKVMLRKMTEEEKEILDLNTPVKSIKNAVIARAGPTQKRGPRLAKSDAIN